MHQDSLRYALKHYFTTSLTQEERAMVQIEGLQCTETAILALPFRYSLADALAA